MPRRKHRKLQHHRCSSERGEASITRCSTSILPLAKQKMIQHNLAGRKYEPRACMTRPVAINRKADKDPSLLDAR